MSDIAIFEQPLSERYRLFLRTEQLFERLDHHMAGDSAWDTHAALQAMLELLQTVSRGDSKRELLKELDRQRTALSRFDAQPAVDRARLGGVLHELQGLIDDLHAITGTLGQELRANELITQLQQRATTGGYPGVIELPGYQQWLARPVAERRRSMEAWLDPLTDARRGIDRCLQLAREAADWESVEARSGFHEQALEAGPPIQLLRVRLDPRSRERGRFPEISAGRQRFTIRFFEQRDPARRATQISENIEFELALCGV
ncbi:MAG: cell division protein ZapD [Halofilum sp. (in: g-proteobacteria)]|nr:cell division protein ZapD [Halofilum sp. (in: g-proteobacteria)]